MSKKLSTRITAVVAATCIFATTVLLCGCIDFNGKKERKYIIEYMDAIPVTCTEYRLAEWDDSKYASSTDEDSKVIIINGIEKKIDVEMHTEKNFTLTIDEKTVDINKEFMAERSAEYVTISEMWYRYNDNMENYSDDYIPSYSVCVFDNNIFIVTRFRRGGGAWWFRYKGSMPACLFKYDIENDTVLYAGYFMRDYMMGQYQIERTEQE